MAKSCAGLIEMGEEVKALLKQAITFILCLLLIVACAQDKNEELQTVASPTAVITVTDAPTSTPTSQPTATAVPTPTVPDIAVADQVLMDDGQLTIASVISNQPGWLVIYEIQDEEPGDILGYTAVNTGINQDLTVTIDPRRASPTVAAVLHVDEGQAGEFEFPNGPDVPLEYESGRIAAIFSLDFQLSTPVIAVNDQEILEDGLVTIESVLVSDPGWLLIQADENGQLGPYLGAVPLQAGLNQDLIVHIPWRQGTTTLYALIYEDNGREQQLDVPGEDIPLVINNNLILEPFQVTYPPDLFVIDQPVVDGKFQVERVYSNGPGWLVVYFDNEGEPGLIIGSVALEDGLNENIEVEVLKTAVTNPLHIRLHEDTEPGDEFDFPRVDPPIVYEGRQIRPFTFNTEPGNYLIVRDLTISQSDDGFVDLTIPYTVVQVPAWLVIQADNNGLPGEILGFTQLKMGLERDLIVSVPSEKVTDILHAVLYLDAGVIGEFEYPNGEDIPLQRNRQVLEIPFNVTREQDTQTE